MPMASGSLHEVDLVAGLERYDRLLPVGPAPLVASHPLELALVGRGADVGDLHVEDGLHRLPDLHLVGVGAHLEGDDVVLFLLPHALLGHDRPQEHLARAPAHRDSASSSASSALRSNTAWWARRIW